MRPLHPLLVALLALPTASPAQRLSPAAFPSVDAGMPVRLSPHLLLRRAGAVAGPEDDEADMATLILGGLLGGVGGLYAGAVIGAGMAGGECEDCWLAEAFYGAAVGSALGIAAGVHLANHSRGSLGQSALASLAIAGGGILAGTATGEWGFLLAVPIGQLASAVTIERKLQVD